MTRTRSRNIKRIRYRKGSVFLRSILFVLLVLAAIYFFLQSSLFDVRKVVVKGLSTVDRQQIIQLSGIQPGLNILRLDVNRIKTKVLTHPMIKSVKVSRRFPDRVVIEITERNPLALIPSATGFMVVDEEGSVLKKVQEISNLSLPLLTGVVVNREIFPGEAIRHNKNLEEGLRLLQSLTPEQRQLIAELDVANLERLKAYTPAGLEVRLGTGENIVEKMALLETIHYQWVEQGKIDQLEYIDLSYYGSPVVKYRQ
ncbi:cell division protein FtsQ/DivIB [Calderihabitans maritimus]|uniref:Polypeptide-transport-associated domain-containing protein FtsQ-type n=1 Tax=Calderihabitans maritimus TaxID=1246530 RepID=A0A1Z5HS83_9FIRM|nr:FtsQ-type POTRA domain-containing protein [Calderihabitans maritimus]GAW92140.1 polypeptide-transport-associated domain-containing protein FtsQ-type [Calderihabitans maritimus]